MEKCQFKVLSIKKVYVIMISSWHWKTFRIVGPSWRKYFGYRWITITTVSKTDLDIFTDAILSKLLQILSDKYILQ